MLRILFSLDWRKSRPHLLLLSKFLAPHTIDDFSESDGWTKVLGENASQAVQRFQKEQLLQPCDLAAILSYRFKVSELKSLLADRGLPTSGSKDALIKRLLEVDRGRMQREVSQLALLQCSEQGREIAESFLVEEESKRVAVEQRVLESLRRRNFRKASQTVAEYEAQQVFWRGIGVDWENHDPKPDVAKLNIIFSEQPRILKGLSEEQKEPLRIAAAMMHLWGTNSGKKWLSSTPDGDPPSDPDVAIRMWSFFASQKASLAEYRRNSDVVTHVAVSCAPDACDACRRLAGKKYPLSKAPELPHEHCTHKKGCRCAYLPITKSWRDLGFDIDEKP